MQRKLLFLSIPALIIAFAFSNCGQLEALDSLTSASIQTCTAKLRSKVAVDFPATLCEDVSTFECERRVFKPGVEDGKSKSVECFAAGRKADVCVNVTEIRYNTEPARTGADAKDFDLGGEYNREEVQCWNSRVQKQNVSVIHADADSLSEALLGAIDDCQARSAQ